MRFIIITILLLEKKMWAFFWYKNLFKVKTARKVSVGFWTVKGVFEWRIYGEIYKKGRHQLQSYVEKLRITFAKHRGMTVSSVQWADPSFSSGCYGCLDFP